MKLTFLGGADEVGGSCTLVEIGGRKILVDCGARMKSKRGTLPHLSPIENLDAILVTHAHHDHIGALPVIHGSFPHVPIYTTAPTAAIMHVMLSDAQRLMEMRSDSEGELPLYPPEAVDILLAKLQKVSLYDPIPLGDEGLTAQFFPSGHILGAAAIGFDAGTERLLMSGDFTISPQYTVPGMLVPRFQPDFMVVESTYGDRLHASREAEEMKLIQLIKETTENGGKVLIPAFALGRAQEILLILRRAIARKALPPIPIFADGMVKAICEVYKDFPEYLHVPLRRHMAKAHPFFPENGTIMRVNNPKRRDDILAGPPCVIVASSGMLTGGASIYYAQGMAEDAKNLIALVGYQDEESPGRALLDLADGKASELTLKGKTLIVKAKVARVGLSAHADQGEIAGLVSKLKPAGVALVHGEGQAREALAKAISYLNDAQIHLPTLGETIEFTPEKRHRRRTIRGISEGAPLDPQAIAILAAHVQTKPRRMTARELTILWSGDQDVTPESIDHLTQLLAETPYFRPDKTHPFLYRLADPDEPAEPPPGPPPLTMQRLLDIVDTHLSPEAGLYRRGLNQDRKLILLYFNFPAIARDRHATTIAAIESETGWRVLVNEAPRMNELTDLALSLLGPDYWIAHKAPSVHLDRQCVVVKVVAIPPDADERCQRFLSETGFQLKLELAASPNIVMSNKRDGVGRLEINAAFAAIDQAFHEEDHRPRKKSMKTGLNGAYIEVAFISGAIAKRYQDLLDKLSAEIGWEMAISESADQGAIASATQSLLPADWTLVRQPSFHLARSTIVIRLPHQPDDQILTDLRQQVAEKTGFLLEVEVR